MGLSIEIVNINDEQVDFELRNLIKAAFGSAAILPGGHLANNINSKASRQSFFLAAKENGSIIGCNAFLANDFTLNGKSYVGYQSCWTATHPAHRGKGIFTAIINAAKKILKDDGAGFIYGIANDDSHPIFVNKLGFKEIPSVVIRILKIPFYKNLYLKNPGIDANDVCAINEQQVKEHKLLQFPSAVKSVQYKKSWVWGKLASKEKMGIKMPAFYVGGFHLADAQDMEYLLEAVFKAYKVFFIQVLSCGTNNINPLLKGWKQSKQNPFIFYNLNMPAFSHFNIMMGAIDVF